MQDYIKKTIILTICAITLILTSIMGTYAYFITNLSREEKQELTVNLGTLALVFEDNSDGINATLSLGQSITKEFKIRNTGTQDVTTNMLFSELINTYMKESLSYKLDYRSSEEGEWTEVETASKNVPISETASDKNLAKNITIPTGEIYYYRLTITFNDLDINQNADIDAIFTSKFKIGESASLSEETLDYLRITPNEGTPNFAEPATTDEGVFAMEDDYGTSYYFRGAVENNYVKFGDFYWRIIRINGDGSLRIQYDGTQGYENGVSNKKRLLTGMAFNKYSNDNKYAGWMFGGAQGTPSTSREQAQTNETNSDLKTLVDSWYKTNIEDKNLGDNVADVIFCNDRTVPGKEITGWDIDTGLGYEQNYVAYGATARTNLWNTDLSKVQPRFTCPQKNDAFTVSDEELGNGDLTYPVGLITADEIVAAGSGKYATLNEKDYLFKYSWYWTLSPQYYNNSILLFTGGGGLSGVYAAASNPVCGAAPVINLKSEYVQTMIGDGSINNPYRDSNDTL